jgi:hypothetical protein
MSDITLFTIETQRHDLARLVIGASYNNFPTDRVKVFADREVISGAEHVQVGDFAAVDSYHNGLYAYCQFMTKELVHHIDTSHALFVQSDAMVVNPIAWTPEFLEYDYIGAPWPFEPPSNNVGNGGFSLRSKKLLLALQDPRIQLIKGPPGSNDYRDWAEDAIICNKYKDILVHDYGIRFPKFELAGRFSFEYGQWEARPFGVHGLWNIARYADRELVEQIPDIVTVDIWHPQRAARFVDNCMRRGWDDIANKVITTVVDQRPRDVVEFTNWCGRLNADVDRTIMK